MAEFVVGLTGGVASGKSAVGLLFELHGVVVIDADVVARAVVEPGQAALAEIAVRFGADLLSADGTLDRVRMRQLVFADASARQALEAITHPRIRLELQAQAAQAKGSYCIAAIPLLAEIGSVQAYPWLQRVLVVDSPVSVQRERLIARDGVSAELAERMILAQASRSTRLAIASDVIINDARPEDLEDPVLRLHCRFVEASRATAP